MRITGHLARTATALLLAMSLPSPGAAQESLLVDARWLHQRLQDPRVVVVHTDYSDRAYAGGHIPGARFLGHRDFTVDGEVGMELPPAAEFERAMRGTGVSDSSMVVISGDLQLSARLFMTLDAFGHRSAALLDGGLRAWTDAGYPLSTGPSNASPGDFTAREVSAVVSAQWVFDRLRQPGYLLMDVRTADEYTGADSGHGGAHTPGHLPGARRLGWEELLDPARPGRFRAPGELRRMIQELGAAPGDTVVTYCMIGRRASVGYFAARLLGYPARLFDGSITEWTRRGWPTVIGDQGTRP